MKLISQKEHSKLVSKVSQENCHFTASHSQKSSQDWAVNRDMAYSEFGKRGTSNLSHIWWLGRVWIGRMWGQGRGEWMGRQDEEMVGSESSMDDEGWVYSDSEL
jgi:hypothetical protein